MVVRNKTFLPIFEQQDGMLLLLPKNSKTMVTEAENSKNGFSGRKMQIFASKHFS